MRLMPFDAVAGGRALRLVHQDEIIKWAQDALETGMDTPSLRELAGYIASSNWSQFDLLFNNLSKELGKPSPFTSTMDAYARWIADMIVNSEMGEREGCLLLQHVCVAAGYPASLSVWLGLEAELSGIGSWSQQTEAEWRTAVLSEAEAMLRS